MKKFIFLMLLSLLIQGCNGQQQKTAEKQLPALSADTTQPQVNIRVNKKYDDKGNLLQYDSTYSYFYSSPGGSVTQLNPDSFYVRFNARFHSMYDDWFNRSLHPIFYSDSLFKYDFLNNDYFDKRFELNKQRLHHLFREMDSLKVDMLRRHYPGGEMKRIE